MLRFAIPFLALCVSFASIATVAGEDADPTVPVGSFAPEFQGKVWLTEDGG